MSGTKDIFPLVSMVTLLAMAATILVMTPVAKGQLSPEECKGEKNGLKNACRPVVSWQNPSPACCQRVRDAHAECVCPYVTPKLVALVGLQRAIRLIEGCGRRVPRNFKCGSVTTPP